VPIASLAKIMTGYVVLRDRPLPAAGPGPVITVAAAGVAAYARDQRQGQSVVRVAAGETVIDPDVIRQLLARWDAGSEAAFAAKMNTRARQLGLGGTRYADASGAGPGHGERGGRPVSGSRWLRCRSRRSARS